MLIRVRVCALCPTEAQDGCERCRLPLCLAHLPAPHRRCLDCEHSYRVRWPVRLLLQALLLIPVAAGIATMLAVIQTGAALAALGPMVVLSMMVPAALRLARHARLHFLDERIGPQLPEAVLVPHRHRLRS